VLRVTVEATQRLALGTGAEVSYFTATHPFVPGSVLRGALAAAWIAEHGVPGPRNSRTAEFRALFDDAIRYGFLHVAGSTTVPVSARLCKYPKDDAGCATQAVDAAFESRTTCPACGGPTEQGRGQVLLPPEVTLERITRTSIDPATAKAKDGELYAHGALPAGSVLTGHIHGRHDWLEQPRTLRLGGRRTVGGAASFRTAAAPLDPPARWPSDGGRLIVRLAAPAIFVDAAGRPSLAPDADLDLDGCQVQPPRWARPVQWEGWHAASRLPKPDELCAVTGSTYQIAGPADSLQRLAEQLPQDGIGLRRTEGFGDVEVVTRPWRPPPAVAAQAAGADTGLRRRHGQVRDMLLDPGQRRWLADALRELQLERQRLAGDSPAAAEVAEAILARPAAQEFSGRQRDLLRGIFAEPGTQMLRDLTTLLLAELPAAGLQAPEAE
jgi:CRISPR-associated protein Csx10